MKTHPLHIFSHCPKCGSARFTDNDERSRRCADCGFVYYLNASGSTVALIENSRGEWLVTRRAKSPAKGTLDLPGGFIDFCETAEEGVAREVREETGLEVTHVEYLWSLPNTYEYGGMTIPTIDLFFRCRVADDSVVTACDDAAECMWLSREELCPADFGLRSISEGVRRLLSMSGRQDACAGSTGKGQAAADTARSPQP